ncbi:hypothetical protein M3Y97_00756000 [Aphelenchoides bicaudatus]|nr:hypothetical protein M3Y97_00756000 [Aphelenchoides bicaudatus]
MQSSLDLEIVQVHPKDDKIQVRVTPQKSKPVSVFFESLQSAFAWLIQVLEDKKIRLMVLKDFELTDEIARIQMAISPRSIELFSMTNVCLHYICPDNFQSLIRNPFKARKYTFNSMLNVHEGSFCDNLLLSNAFMHAISIELHVSTFLPEFSQRMSRISEEGITHWFFNGPSTAENRYFICNSVELGPKFIENLLERFKKETMPNPTSLVLYGQPKQYESCVAETLQGRQKLMIKNEETGEYLKIQYLLDEKLELQRVIEKAITKLRPFNSPAPGCAMQII